MVKVNVTDNMSLAEQYQIQYLPTLMVFKGGEQVNSHVGLASPDQLQQMIDAA